MFKKISEQEVKETLVALISENGYTTALDVKKSLRKSGFWALQSNVSDLLGSIYEEAGTVRNDNGSYFVYAFNSSEDEDEDDYDYFGCCATSGQIQLTNDEDSGSDTDEDEDSAFMAALASFSTDIPAVKTIGRSKIIGEPTQLSPDNYELTISHNSETVKLTISNDASLKSAGDLLYEVRTGSDNWYLYSDDKDVITRHKAIYYVWKVISQEYDGFLAYADLRSTKLYR